MLDSKIIDINSAYHGVAVETLMENAGREISKQLEKFDNIVFFAGKGNNGGDALVAARRLTQKNKDVTVYLIEGERSRLCQLNFERLPDSVNLKIIKSSEEIEELNNYGVIVDGILGTGFIGDIKEPIKSIIEKINGYPIKKISIDTPSGNMFESDEVLALHNEKIIGSKVLDIGIPSKAETECGPGDVVVSLPKRSGNSHKGQFGNLLVLAGSRNYIGTPVLVGQSALKTGTDLVTLSVPQYVADKIPYDPNLIITPLKPEDFITVDSLDQIDEKRYDAIVIGNGMGTHNESKNAVKKILEWEKPTVLDADALNLLNISWLHEKTILTPHKKEFSRLFGENPDDELEIKIQESAIKNGTTIVLKGQTDLISNGVDTRINKTGNPFMTVGGTGDVLAGIIGGLLAQNQKTFLSACAGTFLCGLAGDLAAKELSQSLTATDLIQNIQLAIKKCYEYQK